MQFVETIEADVLAIVSGGVGVAGIAKVGLTQVLEGVLWGTGVAAAGHYMNNLWSTPAAPAAQPPPPKKS
jgi:hypothetical protein